MSRHHWRVLVAWLAVAVGGIDQQARAGGIVLYELTTPEVGRASAGWAARANDATTLFTNPAGMARLTGGRLLASGQLTYGQFGFKPDANTTVVGNDGGNPLGWLPGGGLFYTHDLPSGWNLGIGALSYFGLGAKYDQGWVGRYSVQETALLGLTLMPAASYRVNEHLSFGAGFNWMFGVFEQESAVKNLAQPDGKAKLSDTTQGYGANVGVLGEVSEATRFGLTYLSPVKLDFEDTPEFSGLGTLTEAALRRAGILGAKIGLGMTVPQTIMASAYHQVCDGWSVMGNVGWQNWNKFGKTRVSIADTVSTTADLDYTDTWHGALGVEWGVAPAWLLTGGVAYDSSPVNDQNRTLATPMAAIWRFGVGGEWAASESIHLALAYELQWLGDMAVDESLQLGNVILRRVSGTYESSALHAVSGSLKWDF